MKNKTRRQPPWAPAFHRFSDRFLKKTLTGGGTAGLIEESAATQALVAGVLEWEPAIVRTILQGVGIAGGIPRLTLEIEEAHGGPTPPGWKQQARRRLGELEQAGDRLWNEIKGVDPTTMVAFLERHRTQRSHFRTDRADETFKILGAERRTGLPILEGAYRAARLFDLLNEQLPLNRYEGGLFPARLGDYLMGEQDNSVIPGQCLPTHLLAAHLIKRWGGNVQIVSHLQHVNLLDPRGGTTFFIISGVGVSAGTMTLIVWSLTLKRPFAKKKKTGRLQGA